MIPNPNPYYSPGTKYPKYKPPERIPQKRGISYPLRVVNGALGVSEDLTLIQEQIYSVLETQPGDRVLRQDYGLQDTTFDALNPTFLDVEIRRVIEKFVPDVDTVRIHGVLTDAENGIYRVSVYWTVRGIKQDPIILELNV